VRDPGTFLSEVWPICRPFRDQLTRSLALPPRGSGGRSIALGPVGLAEETGKNGARAGIEYTN